MVDTVYDTFEYCKSIVGLSRTPICNWQESMDLLDCSDKEDIGRLSCHFAIFDEYYYSKIIMQFPKDENFKEINDFEKCEQPLFFQNFDNAPSKLNQRRQNLTIYSAKFDLSKLTEYTNQSTTTNVFIRADTVYMTNPLVITYNLTITARIVSINYPLKMVFDKKDFKLTNTRTMTLSERHVLFNDGLIMRQRVFGFIDIIDMLPLNLSKNVDILSPILKNSSDVDVTSWFNHLIHNFMYVCARSLIHGKDANQKLALDIANFNLNLHDKQNDVGNIKIYLESKKFIKIHKMTQEVNIHVIPRFSLDRIEKLSSVMYTNFQTHWEETNELQKEIKNTQDRLIDMETNFQIIEEQQEIYFENEKNVLKGILEGIYTNASLKHR